ncbi:Zn-ribbon domain-containing OB-fold protein [Streptomyces sp. NPDC020141]|uniref:Zn-ribbon domain-containing OB-fold protein n=1 Tax=Streptomyces sp. NPDC020141 TaxID=3365065 RepID=UPI0037AF54E2
MTQASPQPSASAVPSVLSAPSASATCATPEIDAFTRPYWEAAGAGRLLVRRCRACARAHHYPREFCPYCWSDEVDWETASGRAVLYTWSVVHRNDLPPFGARTPYVAAVVDLAEGPRMATEVVGWEEAGGGLRVGMPLKVAFRPAPDGPPIPVFRPTTGGAGWDAAPRPAPQSPAGLDVAGGA